VGRNEKLKQREKKKRENPTFPNLFDVHHFTPFSSSLLFAVYCVVPVFGMLNVPKPFLPKMPLQGLGLFYWAVAPVLLVFFFSLTL
jgi:sterol desaturase/sphingolipid hydroxylase (fatty acid hydroxylase superfamily)